MAARPNFSSVRLKDNDSRLSVAGESNEKEVNNIVNIQVFLAQDSKAAGGQAEQKMAMGVVAQAGKSWTAEFDNDGLVPGPAVAVGIETHKKPFTAITWAQQVEILK